ncbi:MAG: hypothetical protein A2133_05695 [Actinobacteria bacterium RBG_16_64_13]|nr:MAG: hypothetical protein A2133_05695 [Actinobacteria bacterium RBG_16_64_13]
MARKLVKEMEDHKVSRPTHVSVSNRYTIFLCPEDYERLSQRMGELTAKLERHLSKHVRTKRYEIPDEVMVEMVLDDDLKLGHFGILAQREAPGFVEEVPPLRVRQDPPLRGERAAPAPPEPAAVPLAGRAAPVVAERPKLARKDPESGSTMIIAPADATDYGLARQTIVIRAGNRVREFTQGRVIVGRARDADFRIDNPDVSRRHAVISWSKGSVVLEDLGSTNGTMVNGYPVSSAVVGPDDDIVIGDCRMRVEAC